MQKPLVFNRTLHKKWKEEENTLLANKLELVKSLVDLKCPVSYVTYKTKLKREKPMNSLLREYEIRRDNEIMAGKITKIFTSKSPMKAKQNIILARSLEKAKAKSEKEKWKIYKIAQENQSMLKRLHEAQSAYNHNKYNDDYKKSLYYKKNICVFPDIHQIPGKTTFTEGFGAFNKNPQKTMTDFNKTARVYGGGTKKSFQKTDSKKTYYCSSPQETFRARKNQVLLFSKTFFFQDLMQCQARFFLECKRFIIKIKPVESSEQETYYLIFNGAEEIMKMKNVYRSYDDIIKDLDHNIHSDLVIIKNPKFKSLYITFKTTSSHCISEDYEIEDILSKISSQEIQTLEINDSNNVLTKASDFGIRNNVDTKNNPRYDMENKDIYQEDGAERDEKSNNNNEDDVSEDTKKKKEFEDEINSDEREHVQINNLVSDEEVVDDE